MRYQIADISVDIPYVTPFAEERMTAYQRTDVCSDTPDMVLDGNVKVSDAGIRLADGEFEFHKAGAEFSGRFPEFDGFVLHASCVVIDGEAYCFSAPCGTGKSTHTKLWQSVFGADRAVVINDDKPALRRVDGLWYAYGTPWSGKYNINSNRRAALKGICFIQRGETNSILPTDREKILPALKKQTFGILSREQLLAVLPLYDALYNEVPFWTLHCNMEPEAAILSYTTMSGKEFHR